MAQSALGASGFEERRRVRRFRMIVELTAGMIGRNQELSYREAKCLIECACKSIQSLSPAYAIEFDLSIRPELERMVRERWPFEDPEMIDCDSLVN